jgi:tRNA (adenine57-N1/adenine58-N1)-methyltransferase
LIVTLLDIHGSFQNPLTESGPLLEILEAGTGHGALTLYLARAIHAANPLASSDDRRHQRGAIIHSLDISPTHSEHARKIVEGFRRGLYMKDVEFHVGDISKWIDQQVSIREQERRDSTDKTFMSHIILDLPSSHTHVEKAAAALRTNGNLLVFNPSVTQINACVQLIKQRRLPLQLDRILELGSAVTGGREWDIRAVKPRALLKAENEKKANVMVTVAESMDEEARLKDNSASITRDEEQAQAMAEDDAGWEMICRPKPWTRTVGGGFLAVWKKMRDRREQSS